MAIKTVIFDLDNTLVNRRTAFYKYSNWFIDRFVDCSDSDSRTEIIGLMRAADRDGYRKKQELYTELRECLRMRDPETTADELLQFWFSEFYKCTELMDGALEALEHLKSRGYSLGLITNGSVHSQNSKIDLVGIRGYFDAILVSDEVGVKKPDRRIFEIALDRLKADPGSTCYVGDQPVNDIQGARAAGLQTVWLEGFKDWENHVTELPHYSIKNLADLRDICV